MTHRFLPCALFAAFVLLAGRASAAPVLNEIMYRPGSTYPENTALEFIEIYNPDATAVDMSGWAITTGADFTFPSGTTIAANGYLVVVANVASFQAAYPTVPAAIVKGPWATGATLSDKGEKITLAKPGATAGRWETVDSVSYADEGDWAVRNFNATTGWLWVTGANGAGKSLERRNPALANDHGQAFGDSTPVGGSPGAVNSLLTSNIAPIIMDVQHSPAVPRSTEAVTISCKLDDESAATFLSATLYYRDATTTTPGSFSSVTMTGNGNGFFSATLPATNADKAIREFYISATDGTFTRTWPAPTSTGQDANCQYQADNEVVAGTSPTYRLVLTAAENAAYAAVAAASNRQFNVTFVASRGDDPTIRYRTSIRNRGQTSRNYTYRPIRVSFPTDDRWDDVTDFAINPKFPWCQFIGMRALQAAGVAGGDATPVELRLNGVERTVAGTSGDYGRWVRIEDIGGDYVDNHWPEAPGGQVYRAESMSSYWASTGAAPANPDLLWNGWSKQNAHGINDWSDVVNFSTVWQNTAGSHFTGHTAGNVQSGTWNNVPFTDAEVTTLSTVADFDHMARFMAIMTIIQDNEPCVSNGGADDYAAAWIQNALGQRRLQLLPHDLDNVLGKGDTAGSATGTGLYDMTETGSIFEPLLPLFGNSTTAGNAAFRTKYLTAIRELYGSIFDADTSTNSYPPFYAFIDNHLADWLPDTIRTQLKTFATTRQAHLLGLIGQPKIVPAPTSTGTFTTTFNGALRINEVLARNVAAHLNGTTYPDVIELRNTSAVAIDLSDKSLSDEASTPRKYVFPTGTTIAANSFLLIYADPATTQPGLHTGFELDATGDSVRLYDSVANGGALIDEVVFGPQVADRTIARTAAAESVWALTVPTLNAANGNGVTLGTIATVKINEWAGNTDFRLNSDFIELYNSAANPAPLGGAHLTDDAANYPARQTFPTLSFIGAASRVLLEEDDLGFALDANFGYLTLLGANGALLDQVSIVSQFGDRSTGRSTDGAATTADFAIASPGIANQTAPAAYAALIAGLRITEVMYAPTGGNIYEFIELQNIGTTTLDLSGVRFTNGIDYTFASGTTLAAGAYTVICRDRTAFLARYPAASSALAAGAFTGAIDNSGETLALSLPVPWDVNILKFRYETTWYPLTATSGYSLVTVNQAASLPKDWDEQFTWAASPAQYGTPGSDGPPTITSATTASGVLGDAFTYQITATKSPTSFGALNLPANLSINTTTGLISGTPAAPGTFNVTISATNPGGTTSIALTLTIATSGPLHHFTWNYLPATINAGTAFPARVTARDSAERLVTTYAGTAAITAASGGASSGPPVVLTEVTDGAEDQFELQNVTNAAANTTGWFVIIGDNQTTINTLNTVIFTLPASVAASALVVGTEIATPAAGKTYFGGAIAWTSGGATSRGWIALFDASKTMRDFMAFGWTQAEIATLNVTAANGAVINPSGNSQWTGAGTVLGTRSATANTDSWRRIGTADNNIAADWPWTQGTANFTATNAGLALPWITSTPIAVTPASGAFAAGEFLGYLQFATTASSVRLTAAASGYTGQSTAFDILAAPADTDADGIADAYETANGLIIGTNDANGDLDGDGATNLAEFLAGTAANDPRSHLAITTVSLPATAQMQIIWPAVAGKLYRIQTSENLTTWTPLGLVLATTTGAQTVTFTTGGATTLFARVEILSAP